MAAKIFLLTSNYDLAIHNWIQKSDHNKIKNKEIKLRYGENPHQKSYLIKNTSNKNFVDNLIQGKNLSFNNIKDSEAGFNCINEFKKPTSVIIKHSSPCGVASSTNILIAFKNSIKSDPISSFGGVIVLNRVVGKKIAFLISKKFYEIILAPKFTKDAIKIMGINKNLRLIKTQNIKVNNKNETYSINGGHLIQEKNKIILNQKDLKLKTKFRGDINIINQLIFAYKVSKYVKSNAIVLVYNDQTLSISGGQTSRIEATKNALNKIKNKKQPFVLASDAFFPFTDGLKLLSKKNCKAVLQPSGSINDYKIVDFANKIRIPLYFVKFRFFRH